VEIGTDAAQFLEKEYITVIFVAVQSGYREVVLYLQSGGGELSVRVSCYSGDPTVVYSLCI